MQNTLRRAMPSILGRLNSSSRVFSRSFHVRSANHCILNNFKTKLLPTRPSRQVPRLYSLAAQPPRPASLRTIDVRCFSANREPPTGLPVLSPPVVGRWLLLSSTLVFAIIVVGGVTRLTESGLSITEWQPITGILPPWSEAEWNGEFEKYKATPEFKLTNHSITLDQFKSIFYMEWTHRILGRTIGLAFVAPLTYFFLRKKLSPSLPSKLSFLALLIGAQGFLGWYMVKSGLEDSLMDIPGTLPRVSQYRLAAHLGTALVLFAGMFGTGLATIQNWRFAHGEKWSGLDETRWTRILNSGKVKRFGHLSRTVTGLVFLTALSGAFVAGLDAGLVYNEFPRMGEHCVPPLAELFSPAYAKTLDGSDSWWRNIFENPTTVQFNHRVLATTTYISTFVLFAQTLRPSLRILLPPITRTAAAVAFTLANIQVLLGISTLIYLVPVPLAATHQAGSVVLLGSMVYLLTTLRRPGVVANMWRQSKAGANQL